jgi:hypothetical protein
MHGEKKRTYRILIGHPKWKIPYCRSRRELEDNNKMDLK